MRIATWNVNSITARLPRLLAWLESSGTDVLCLQEAKVAEAQFPVGQLRELGYESASLWSFAANERANAFYEAAGFTRDGSERTEEVWGHIPELRYRRSL